MSKSLCGHVAFVFTLVMLTSSVELTAQQMSVDKNQVQFPDDFLSFLKGLGSMVYTYKSKDKPQNTKPSTLSTTQKMKILRRSENSVNTQKAALKDVLMMKLVSYYEDKYKLAHHEVTTFYNPEYKNEETTNLITFKQYDYAENITSNPVDDNKKSNDPGDLRSDAEILVI